MMYQNEAMHISFLIIAPRFALYLKLSIHFFPVVPSVVGVKLIVGLPNNDHVLHNTHIFGFR
jgi:hypothetical protein